MFKFYIDASMQGMLVLGLAVALVVEQITN